jgi:hypothetical protein
VFSTLSVDLPDSISELATARAFDRYTTAGPTTELESQLRALSIEDLFPGGAQNPELASCCLSGLFLLHNFLDLSHTVSQEIETPEGSFWHAIMHRLEGDFWNSKYWYRKVGPHPVFDEMPGRWDPFDFVDQCEKSIQTGGSNSEKIQHTAVAEWKSLFEFCFRNAGK